MAKEIKLYTILELVDILHVTRRSIYEWIKTGKLHAVKLGKEWRVREEDLDAFLAKGTREK